MFTYFDLKYETPHIASGFNAWLDIHAPIETVFQFLTGERELMVWWANRCTSEPKPGGRVHFSWDGDPPMTGDAIFRQFEPPVKVIVEWQRRNGEPIVANGKDPRGMYWPALNIYELVHLHTGTTRLFMQDLGVNSAAEYDNLRQATLAGWQETLTRLKRAVEGRHREEVARKMKERQRQEKHSS